jgi:hypothetical protein
LQQQSTQTPQERCSNHRNPLTQETYSSSTSSLESSDDDSDQSLLDFPDDGEQAATKEALDRTFRPTREPEELDSSDDDDDYSSVEDEDEEDSVLPSVERDDDIDPLPSPTPAPSPPPKRKRKAPEPKTSSAPKKKPKVKETPVVNPYLGRIAEFYATADARSRGVRG